MKKNLILPECEWILTKEAMDDNTLNPTDKNVLAVMQCVFDKKNPLKNGYYTIILYKKENAAYSLQGDLEAFGFSVSESTVWRSVNKLWRFGYIDYKQGFWNMKTNSGQPTKIRILKGTIHVTNSVIDDYSDIENAKDSHEMDSKKLSTDVSGSYSVIEDRKSKSKSKSKSKALPIAPYGIGDLGLEKNDLGETDCGCEEETTFLDGEGVEPDGNPQQPKVETVDVKALYNKYACDGKVMGDMLELMIDKGFFVTDIEVGRVIDVLKAKCPLMELNADYYLSLFKEYEEKNRLVRLMK